MVLARWEPFAEFDRMSRMMDEMFNRYWGSTASSSEATVGAWPIPVDVIEREDHYEVQASLPGLHPNQVQVTLESGILTIRGETSQEAAQDQQDRYLLRERRFGSFYRTVRLPEHTDFDKAEAHYDYGVLKIILPKAESVRPRRLSIQVGDQAREITGTAR
jgi:HSP20 family protein